MGELGKSATRAIEEPDSSALGTDPHVAASILKHRHDAVCRKAGRIRIVVTIMPYPTGREVKTIETLRHRTNPQNAVSIEHQRHYSIVTYRIGIARLVAKAGRSPTAFVDPCKTAAESPDPDVTDRIGGERGDIRIP